MDATSEVLFGWGLSTQARSRVYRPTSVEDVRRAVQDARDRGLTVGHRGAGQSYGDAALNQGGAVLAMSGLDDILEYEAQEGVVRAGAGVTIDQLWRAVLEDGWWPPVVPGTSRPTLGGCAAADVHGKNHWRAGAFGDHVRAATVLWPDGEIERLQRSARPGALRRHLGGLGLTGTILAVTVDLKRVHSGYLRVEGRTAPNLAEALRLLELFSERRDYAVAWVDCFARGDRFGRSELHAASHLAEDHDRAGEALDPESQRPDDRGLGLVPGSVLKTGLGAVLSDPGMRSVNAAKYALARARHPSTYLQTHASFHFLLDHVPDWRRAYEPGGLIQYQLFVPADEAPAAFREALELQHEIGLKSYLGVMKRHREEPGAETYTVDGYSLALDFAVRDDRLGSLMSLVREYDRLQSRVGGRVYAAKDAVSGIGRLPEWRHRAYATNLSRRWERHGSTNPDPRRSP